MSLKIKLRCSPFAVNSTSDTESPQRQRNNVKNIKVWRERLKNDEVKLAEFRLAEAARAKEYRNNKNAIQKEHDKENNRERQRRFQAKKKDVEGNVTMVKRKKESVKILTRNEWTQKREYNKQKKREEREKMSAQKRRRIREKDAARKREKRNKGNKIKERPLQPDDRTEVNSGFKTAASKRMAVSRMWTKVPKDLEKFAGIVFDFVNGVRTTPRKRAAVVA